MATPNFLRGRIGGVDKRVVLVLALVGAAFAYMMYKRKKAAENTEEESLAYYDPYNLLSFPDLGGSGTILDPFTDVPDELDTVGTIEPPLIEPEPNDLTTFLPPTVDGSWPGLQSVLESIPISGQESVTGELIPIPDIGESSPFAQAAASVIDAYHLIAGDSYPYSISQYIDSGAAAVLDTPTGPYVRAPHWLAGNLEPATIPAAPAGLTAQQKDAYEKQMTAVARGEERPPVGWTPEGMPIFAS
jgi:hypothetical protein